jgi:hypothetical protein
MYAYKSEQFPQGGQAVKTLEEALGQIKKTSNKKEKCCCDEKDYDMVKQVLKARTADDLLKVAHQFDQEGGSEEIGGFWASIPGILKGFANVAAPVAKAISPYVAKCVKGCVKEATSGGVNVGGLVDEKKPRKVSEFNKFSRCLKKGEIAEYTTKSGEARVYTRDPKGRIVRMS